MAKKNTIVNKSISDDESRKVSYFETFINKNELTIDDELYHYINSFISNYYKNIENKFFDYVITKDIMNQYIDICSNTILKINKKSYEYESLKDICFYLTYYTKTNIDYKMSIIKYFNQIGIIEERDLKKKNTVNPFKKILQVLSVKFKRNYTKKSAELYVLSNSNVIQEKGKKIIQMIVEKEKIYYRINQEHLIKPTDSTMEIACYLPDLVVDTEDDFKKLIDYLYKLFWENNEIKKQDVTGKITFINNIRRYYFHDLEHGKEKDIKKKIKAVNDFFVSSLGKSIPVSAKDWQKIQNYIYDSLLEFLESINV